MASEGMGWFAVRCAITAAAYGAACWLGVAIM